MRKFIAVLLLAMLMLTLAGCSNQLKTYQLNAVSFTVPGSWEAQEDTKNISFVNRKGETLMTADVMNVNTDTVQFSSNAEFETFIEEYKTQYGDAIHKTTYDGMKSMQVIKEGYAPQFFVFNQKSLQLYLFTFHVEEDRCFEIMKTVTKTK